MLEVQATNAMEYNFLFRREDWGGQDKKKTASIQGSDAKLDTVAE